MDKRVGMKVTKNVHVQGLVNNLLNKRYSARPMDVGAPRTFILQVGANFLTNYLVVETERALSLQHVISFQFAS